MAGLGLVVSENAAANLDLDQPFIRVIPENRVEDREYLREAIRENQRVSAPIRRQIRRYGMAHFDWEMIVKSYLQELERMKQATSTLDRRA